MLQSIKLPSFCKSRNMENEDDDSDLTSQTAVEIEESGTSTPVAGPWMKFFCKRSRTFNEAEDRMYHFAAVFSLGCALITLVLVILKY